MKVIVRRWPWLGILVASLLVTGAGTSHAADPPLPIGATYPFVSMIERDYCKDTFGSDADVALVVDQWPDGAYDSTSVGVRGFEVVPDSSISLTRLPEQFEPGQPLTWTAAGNVEILAVRAVWMNSEYQALPGETLPDKPTTINVSADRPAVLHLVVCGKKKRAWWW
jgi:hypothetical protein